jgi:dethiobiotin synthetase
MTLQGLYITGTDTDVGKTRVCAAVAHAWNDGIAIPTVVKLVQTGIARSEAGDAELAAKWASARWCEVGRFRAAADPWSAALAESNRPLRAARLLKELRTCAQPVVVEGSGGAAVPLNEAETLTDVAAQAGLDAIVTVGLRLGCINHALLTISYLKERGIEVAGVVCVERWEPVEAAYRSDVTRILSPHAPFLGTIPFDHDPARSVAAAAPLFATVVKENRSSSKRS